MKRRLNVSAYIESKMNIAHIPTAATYGLFVVVLVGGCWVIAEEETYRFNGHDITAYWGSEHFNISNQGTQVELFMDRYSGAGFTTKRSYGSGFFQMRIKAPRRNSAGVVTAFYLTSVGEAHDELDFEILGNEESRPIRLNTNIFIDGYGNREKTVHLSWFDPTADFHNYTLLWNHRQIVFFVDEVPVRVMRKVDGKSYPATRPMWLQASLWNGEPWAMDTDQKEIDWAYGPFRAYFKDFSVDGCPVDDEGSDLASCSSPEYWWNAEKYWTLDEGQQKAYEHVLEHYQTADYCVDRPHPPECGL